MPYIPLEKCVDGHLYVIEARNAALGIFHEKELGFVISRHKLGKNYLFTEYHWDYGGGPYGTARPYEDLGPVPFFPHHKHLMLKFLNEHPRRKEASEVMIRKSFLRLGINISDEHLAKFEMK